MLRIERQLEYRDKQIEQLNRRCSELQLELEQYMEEREEKGKQEKVEERLKKGERVRSSAKRKRVRIREEEVRKDRDISQIVRDGREEEEEEYRIERLEEEEEAEKESGAERTEEVGEEREKEVREEEEGEIPAKKTRQQLLREATDGQALYGQITQLIRVGFRRLKIKPHISPNQSIFMAFCSEKNTNLDLLNLRNWKGSSRRWKG